MIRCIECYIKILRDMEKVLSSQPLDLDRLGKDEFGIFRLVTDGPGDSPIEQELMSLLKDFHLFRQVNQRTRIVPWHLLTCCLGVVK